eukprot:m.65354 g.65354  ORF g.65354 m.65354 type:complete len:326 (-) comp9756_c0_seq4:225-1202(-)
MGAGLIVQRTHDRFSNMLLAVLTRFPLHGACGRREASDNQETDPDAAGPAAPAPAQKGPDAKAIKEFIQKLELDVIEAWTVQDVVEIFLPNIGLTDATCKEIFFKHRITGPVLLHMSKADIDDLGLSLNGVDPLPAPKYGSGENLLTLGDRVYMWDLLQILQHKRKRLDRTKVVWSVQVPTGGIQYYDSVMECLKYKLCPGCMPYDHYTLTAGDLQIDMRPPRTFFHWCVPTEVSIKDLRFLKDVDSVVQCGNCPFCCKKKLGMMLAFHQETGADDREETEDGEPAAANEADVPHTKFVIWHREMTHEKAQALIAVWAEVRLVGD